jgi:hypothetical protein
MSGPYHTIPYHTKKVQFTQERVEYNVFLFDDSLKGSKSLKIFKINLTFRFDKLSHLSKSVHIGEYSQILTVSNKKIFCLDEIFLTFLKLWEFTYLSILCNIRHRIQMKRLHYDSVSIQADGQIFLNQIGSKWTKINNKLT